MMIRIFLLILITLAYVACGSTGGAPLVLPGTPPDNNTSPGVTNVIPQPVPTICNLTVSPNQYSFHVGDTTVWGWTVQNLPSGVTTDQLGICIIGQKSTDNGVTFTDDAPLSNCGKPKTIFSYTDTFTGTFQATAVGMYTRHIYVTNILTGALICDQSQSGYPTKQVTAVVMP